MTHVSGLPWIRVYTDLPDDERSLLLGSILGNPDAYLHVVALRLWMGRRAPDGVIRGAHADRLVETAAAWRGEPGKFLDAALEAGFLADVYDGPDDEGHPVAAGYADVSWPVEQAAHVAKKARDEERNRRRAEAERLRREAAAGGVDVTPTKRGKGVDATSTAASTSRPRGVDGSATRAVSKKSGMDARDVGVDVSVESRERRVEREASTATQGAPAPQPLALRVEAAESEGVDPDLDRYIEQGFQEDGSPRQPAAQAALVEVPPTPRASPSRRAQATSTPPKTSQEERDARARVQASFEEVRGQPYDWTGDDWTNLRKCLHEPSHAGGDLELLDAVWRYALGLGATWPGCLKLRELASKWAQVLAHREKAGTEVRNLRAERQQLGGDVPRVPGLARIYTGAQ